MNALNVLCAQLTRDLFAIAKLLYFHKTFLFSNPIFDIFWKKYTIRKCFKKYMLKFDTICFLYLIANQTIDAIAIVHMVNMKLRKLQKNNDRNTDRQSLTT